MGLIQIAALSALGYAGYKYFHKQKDGDSAAFATGETGTVRNAGPSSMRDQTGQWSETDEKLDESFPASDPPGNY